MGQIPFVWMSCQSLLEGCPDLIMNHTHELGLVDLLERCHFKHFKFISLEQLI
jgi:hypothetical protein